MSDATFLVVNTDWVFNLKFKFENLWWLQEVTDDEDSVAGAPAPARAMYAALRQDVHRTRRQVQRPDQWSNGGRHYTLAQAGSHAVQRSNGAGYTAKKMSAGPSVRSRICLLYTSPSPRDRQKSRMPSSA